MTQFYNGSQFYISDEIDALNSDDLLARFLKKGMTVSTIIGFQVIAKVNKHSLVTANGTRFNFDSIRPLRDDLTLFTWNEIREQLTRDSFKEESSK